MSDNQAGIERFRRQLAGMIEGIKEVDKKVLNKAVNVGLRNAKENTPVRTGFMRKSWASNPVVETDDGVEKELVNTADYSLYVDAGHRLVNKNGETTGWVEGIHLLDKVVNSVEEAEIKEFEKEIRRIEQSND